MNLKGQFSQEGTILCAFPCYWENFTQDFHEFQLHEVESFQLPRQIQSLTYLLTFSMAPDFPPQLIYQGSINSNFHLVSANEVGIGVHQQNIGGQEESSEYSPLPKVITLVNWSLFKGFSPHQVLVTSVPLATSDQALKRLNIVLRLIGCCFFPSSLDLDHTCLTKPSALGAICFFLGF